MITFNFIKFLFIWLVLILISTGVLSYFVYRYFLPPSSQAHAEAKRLCEEVVQKIDFDEIFESSPMQYQGIGPEASNAKIGLFVYVDQEGDIPSGICSEIRQVVKQQNIKRKVVVYFVVGDHGATSEAPFLKQAM